MTQLRQNGIPCSKTRLNSGTPQATVLPDSHTLSPCHNLQHPYKVALGPLYDDLFVTTSSDGTLKPFYR